MPSECRPPLASPRAEIAQGGGPDEPELLGVPLDPSQFDAEIRSVCSREGLRTFRGCRYALSELGHRAVKHPKCIADEVEKLAERPDGAGCAPRLCGRSPTWSISNAQGATVARTFVLMGGWQTDRERAYVALSRGRDRTDIYVSREDLGTQGVGTGAIERLGEAITVSNAKQPGIAIALAENDASAATPPPGAGIGQTTVIDAEPDSEAGRILYAQKQLAQDRDRDLGYGIE
jgi:hypothetical protein